MPGKLLARGRRSTKSRPFERRRRTRRMRRSHQRGGDPQQVQLLDAWLGEAKTLHDTPRSLPYMFEELKKSSLQLTSAHGGPMLPEESGFAPPYLGDILTSVALGLGQQRIQTGEEFTNAMALLQRREPLFYEMLITLESILRQRAGRTSVEPTPVNLSVPPTDGKTPFVWIAYANLPDIPLEPVAPILVPVEEVSKLVAAQTPQAITSV